MDLSRRYSDTQMIDPFGHRKQNLEQMKPIIPAPVLQGLPQGQGLKAVQVEPAKPKIINPNEKPDPNSLKAKILADDQNLKFQRPAFRSSDKKFD